jgi:hypothetical protein
MGIKERACVGVGRIELARYRDGSGVLSTL